jgi:hypothetical protein
MKMPDQHVGNTYYRAALREIAKGYGKYSRDPLEHCSNVVENMQHIARQALEHKWEPEE